MKKILWLSFIALMFGCAPKQYKTASRSFYSNIDKNPIAYADKMVAFQGDVFNVRETGTDLVFQLLIKDGIGYDYLATKAVYIYWAKPTTLSTDIVDKSYVKVFGVVAPTKVSGLNMFGGLVDSVVLRAIVIRDEGFFKRDYYDPKCQEAYRLWASGFIFADFDEQVTIIKRNPDLKKLSATWIENCPVLRK